MNNNNNNKGTSNTFINKTIKLHDIKSYTSKHHEKIVAVLKEIDIMALAYGAYE